MIGINGDTIEVIGMPLLKRYEKEDEYLDVQKDKPTGALAKLYHWSYQHDAWVRRRYKTKKFLI